MTGTSEVTWACTVCSIISTASAKLSQCRSGFVPWPGRSSVNAAH
ncbi:Uncharacterised protein [Vibrio cholerae]|nr:Uncharacterised protein [Vibrio cholerae]